jgi:hypothetical protein
MTAIAAPLDVTAKRGGAQVAVDAALVARACRRTRAIIPCYRMFATKNVKRADATWEFDVSKAASTSPQQ